MTTVAPAAAETLPGCASSMAAAIAAATGSSSEIDFGSGPAEQLSGGYRVVQQRLDAVLGVRWAMLEACAHPEWPWRAVELHLAAKPAAGVAATAKFGDNTQPVLVRAGEVVLLWSSDAKVQMTLRATAEESGRAGQTIWLHLNVQMEGQAGWQRRRGIVRQSGRVEMVP